MNHNTNKSSNSNLLHVVCPNCTATNRIPTQRVSEDPSCGKCQHALLRAAPIELTNQSAHKVIAKNEILTIVDFWASWCQPCLMMAPQFKVAASQLPQVVFAKLQTDKYEQAAAPYGIRSLPTMVAFKGGKEIARQSGALPSNQIVQWVQGLR